MWQIFEGPRVKKDLRKLPVEILKKYEKWKDLVIYSGPNVLTNLPGLKDEALKGIWLGCRSSRLNIQYRVIYRVVKNKIKVEVITITPHDYRR